MTPNPHRKSKDITLLPPRDQGRGRALDATGAVRVFDWSSGQVRLDGVNLFALAAQPTVLDGSFDSLDRAVVCWRTSGGAGFVWFYDPVPAAYVSLDCGPLRWPAVHNDYRLLGNDIKLVYLVDNVPRYRQHVDKFAVEYQLTADKMEVLKYFGESKNLRTLAAVGFRK